MQSKPIRIATLILLTLTALLCTLIGLWFSTSMASSLASSRFIWVGLGISLGFPLLLALGSSTRLFLQSLIACNIMLVGATILIAPQLAKQAVQEHGSWPAQTFAVYLPAQQQGPFKKRVTNLSGWLAAMLPDGPGLISSLSPEPSAPQGSIKPAKGQKTTNSTTIKFKKSGSTMVVNVSFEDRLTVPLIYDTGASITTIDAATAKRLGLLSRPHRFVEVETANGITRQPIVTLSSLEVGGARVEGPIEVAVCDTCSLSGASGLLGLNFSRAFVTQIDPQAGTITFLPRSK